jgi:hypothetical protein
MTLPLRSARGYSLPFSAVVVVSYLFCLACGLADTNVLSFGLKSKNVVALDMVLYDLLLGCLSCRVSTVRFGGRVRSAGVGGCREAEWGDALKCIPDTG